MLMSEKKARAASEMLAELVGFFTFVMIGYAFIPDIDNTIYPYLLGFLTVYIYTGSFYLRHKNIHPELSKKIQSGEVDIGWGFYFLYWCAWWPMYLKKS